MLTKNKILELIKIVLVSYNNDFLSQTYTKKDYVDTIGALKLSKPTINGTNGQMLVLNSSLSPVWQNQPTPVTKTSQLTNDSSFTAKTYVDDEVSKVSATLSSHTHTKANITDFSHTHTKSNITDFSHTHVFADLPTGTTSTTVAIGNHNHSTLYEPVISTKNTAFNVNFETTATNIKMDGTQSLGTLSTVARADHVHPSDSTRVPTSRTINSKALSSNITLTLDDIGDGTNRSLSSYATTASMNSALSSKVSTTENSLNTSSKNVVSAINEINTLASTASSNFTSQIGNFKLSSLTQGEYDALSTKDSNTLYFIKE